MSDSSGEGENQSYPQGNGTHDKNWEWIACVYDMKRSTAESEITWNLSPSIMLTLPSEQNVQPKVDLIIESSKSFIFSDGLGWNWHKSWNIPDIHCTLDIRDPLTNEKLLPPSKIYAEIYVVRAVINQIHTFHLVDVGIKGVNRSEFESSRCVFTGLKFDTTSYNHEGSKFHLIIVVYLNQNKFEHPKILESRISPPIFVDSRKSARDTQQQKAQKLSSFIDPFLPENLDKKFIKRESKRKYNQDESIDNNIEGLSNFFSAPNIRHKVKHPLFLAVKFSNCVKIYYNTNIIPYTNNNEKFVEVMQKQLMEAYNRSGTNNSLSIEEKPLILTIEHQLTAHNFKQKKINEFLEPLHGDVLHVMIDSVNIPKNFKKLEDIDGVKEAYKKVYPKISQQKFSQAGGDEEDDDDEDSGQQKPPTKGKKAKVEKDAKNKQNLSNDSDDEYAGSQATKKIKQNDADSSQVNSMIESKKLMIANPAQQSEIILNSASQNNQNVANMILLGAKPSKDKVFKGPSVPPSDKPAAQAPPKQEDSLPKGAKGKGKRATKNAAPGPTPAAASSEPTSAPAQSQPPQIQLPNQAQQQQQFPQSVGVPPSNIQGGAQTPSNAAYMQWQQMQSGQQIQQPNASMPGNNISKPQQVVPNGAEMSKQQGVAPNLQGSIQNFPGQYGAQPGQVGGQFGEGIGFEGVQKQTGGMNYPGQQPGFRLPGAPGQVQGSMQNFNGAGQNPAGQRVQHPSSQGYPSQLQPPGVGQGQYGGSQQLPSQAAMQNAQYAATLEKGQSKQNFEDPALALNRNSSAAAALPFKHPQSLNGAAPHLNQSQHYIQSGVQGDGTELPDTMKPSYPPSQIPNSLIQQQYGGQPGQYELFQRNGSQQFAGLPQNPQQVPQPQSLQQQQQQGRFLSQQQQQQQQLAQKQFSSTASTSAAGAGGPGSMAHFYENQINSQFSQHPHSSSITDSVSQQYGGNPMQIPSYSVMPGANGGYPEDEEGSSYQTYNNRYPAASQGGQFPFGQGGQGGQYYGNSSYPPHQQPQQPTIGGQPYGYAQSQYGNYYSGMDPSGQQQYMKPNMNPQFQQFYSQQQQGGVQPDMAGGAQNLQYQSQIRPHSSSIPQNYFGPANGGKEDDF